MDSLGLAALPGIGRGEQKFGRRKDPARGWLYSGEKAKDALAVKHSQTTGPESILALGRSVDGIGKVIKNVFALTKSSVMSPTKKVTVARKLALEDVNGGYITASDRTHLNILFGRDTTAADAYISDEDPFLHAETAHELLNPTQNYHSKYKSFRGLLWALMESRNTSFPKPSPKPSPKPDTRVSRLDDQVVDIGSVGGRWIKNDVQQFVHGKEDSGHERKATDGGEREIFPVVNSTYTATLAALAELQAGTDVLKGITLSIRRV
ncbi:hypothetical protein B0H13DRAFT_1913256 [Mycena leptocephala]|nr:hypothetical protein B0H13DRAFT_1913256 [Mycena leptocephala]